MPSPVHRHGSWHSNIPSRVVEVRRPAVPGCCGHSPPAVRARLRWEVARAYPLLPQPLHNLQCTVACLAVLSAHLAYGLYGTAESYITFRMPTRKSGFMDCRCGRIKSLPTQMGRTALQGVYSGLDQHASAHLHVHRMTEKGAVVPMHPRLVGHKRDRGRLLRTDI